MDLENIKLYNTLFPVTVPYTRRLRYLSNIDNKKVNFQW